MNQNQCVPNWDLNDVGPTTQPLPPPPPSVSRSLTSRSHSASLSAGHDTSMLDYEIAELTWENGHLTMHGLGLPRASSKNNLGGAWSDSKPSPRAAGTLESIVNQATHKLPLPLTPIGECAYDDDLVPFLTSNAVHCPTVPASVSMAMDALVPTDNNRDMGVSKGVVACSTRVGSCSIAPPRVPAYSADWSVSASGSDRWQGVKRPAEDTCEQLRSMTNNEMTSTSFGASLDNTTRTFTVDDRDHDSVCHSRPERERIEEEDNHKKGAAKSISSTKRSRAAAVHNQSERKRRDKINQRMKTLQKLVPNSNKTDKASMLDEVIDYLKQLQAQIQMLNTMRLPSMMMPLAMQQQLQMSMMAPMGMGMGMGMPGMGMNPAMNMDQMNMSLNAMGRQNMPAGISPAVLNPAAYMSLACSTDPGGDRITAQPTSMVPTDPLSTYLACQSHSITMDAYNRVAAMYQQLQQQQQNPNQGSMPGSNR